MDVTLVPTGQRFPVGEREDILTAALRSGIQLRYGCRHGNCSSCKHWLVDGDVDDDAASVYAIPRDEREAGAILLCCTYAESDLVIEIDQHDGVEELPPMEPPAPRRAAVLGVRELGADLVELRVEVERPFPFRAGQYVEITVGDTGQRRSFSLVNPPGPGRELVFCIRRVPGGLFDGMLDELGPGAALDLEAPFGTMFLRDTGRPVLMAATGSGIAPVLSMLADAAARGTDLPIRFYYGVRFAADLVHLDAVAELAGRLPGLTFVPCLSRGAPDGVAGGRAGRVTRVIAEDIRDASPFDAYLCGSPPMCDAVGRLLEAKGLPEARIHADRFYAAVEQTPARR